MGYVEFQNAAQALLAKQFLSESPPSPSSSSSASTPSSSTPAESHPQPLRITFARFPKPPRQNASALDLPGHFGNDQGDAAFAYGLGTGKSAWAGRRREPRTKERGFFRYEKADWKRGVEDEEARRRREELKETAHE